MLLLNSTQGLDTLGVIYTNSSIHIGPGSGLSGHSLDIHGNVEIEHDSTESDDHALEILVEANGFGDVKGILLEFITGAIVDGQDEEAILINVDRFDSTGGFIAGVEVIGTEGGANFTALEVGAEIDVILQESGTFGDMDVAEINGEDNLTAFLSQTINATIFINDNDNISIGDVAKFEEIEVILQTGANQDVRPTFEYSTGANTWTAFSPTDGTDGFRVSGAIIFREEDIPLWAVGVGSNFLIRITRTRNNINTPASRTTLSN